MDASIFSSLSILLPGITFHLIMSLQEVQSTATLLPLEFTPILKRARWGGERLGTQLHKLIGVEQDYGESWELSDYPGAPTLIAMAGTCKQSRVGARAGTCRRVRPLPGPVGRT